MLVVMAIMAVITPFEARNITISYFTPLDTWQYSIIDGIIIAISNLIEIYKCTDVRG
jgi:hypothetical protein